MKENDFLTQVHPPNQFYSLPFGQAVAIMF